MTSRLCISRPGQASDPLQKGLSRFWCLEKLDLYFYSHFYNVRILGDLRLPRLQDLSLDGNHVMLLPDATFHEIPAICSILLFQVKLLNPEARPTVTHYPGY